MRHISPKACFLAIGAMVLMAVGIVMVKGILETRPFLWTTELRLLGGIAGMLIYMALRGRLETVRAEIQAALALAAYPAGQRAGRLCFDDDVAGRVQVDHRLGSLGPE